MFTYEPKKYVLASPYILGLPYVYGIKLGGILVASILICLVAGLKLLIIVLPIVAVMYFYFMGKYKKYGELEVEIRVFNSRCRGIYHSDTNVFENTCYMKDDEKNS